MMTKEFNIGFLVYPDVVQLDVMGAYQVLAFPPLAYCLFLLLYSFMTPDF